MSSTQIIQRPQTSVLRVLVVEDSALIRGILRTLLGRLEGCQLIGEETTADGAIAGFRKLHPSVVLLDLQLKCGTGLEVLQEIGPELGSSRVFVMTNYVEDAFRERCMSSGAYGFYDKSRELGRLLSDLESMATSVTSNQRQP